MVVQCLRSALERQLAHYNQRVDGNNTFLVRINNKWIDIDLCDLRTRGGESAESRSNLCNRAKIESGRATEPGH